MTDHELDWLRAGLHDVAADALVPDLRDQVRRASRRLGVQRALAGTAVAVVLLGAAGGTAVRLAGHTGPTVPPAVGGSPSATSAAPSRSAPTGSPSASPTPGADQICGTLT